MSAIILSMPNGSTELCLVGRAIAARMATPSPGVSISVIGRSTCPWVAQVQRPDGWSGVVACAGRGAGGSCLHTAIIRAGGKAVSTA